MFGGQVLSDTGCSLGRFQLHGDRRGISLLLSQGSLQRFAFFPGSIDFRVCTIFDASNIHFLAISFGLQDRQMILQLTTKRLNLRGLSVAECLQPIALLRELSQLAGLLLDETLDIRQSRLSHLTALIRALRLRPNFGNRDLPELAFLGK